MKFKMLDCVCHSLYWMFSLCFRDLQKATHNFTTVIGQGAFGPVYKAQMSTGETVAVKVLATNSKQGEKEFHTEVGCQCYFPLLGHTTDRIMLCFKA